MDRNLLIDFETAGARRQFARPFELREDDSDPNIVVFEGYSSVTETEYDVYGGPPFGWTETIKNGAFKRTLRAKADVAFLINHGGMTLARTKAKTMDLAEDDTGERVIARLDTRQQPVADLLIASERGDVDEMSFAFRVVKDQWFDDDGNTATWQDGTRRDILEVNQHKGDVSPVNYGANPATSGGFRAVDQAFAELSAGRLLSAEHRALILSLVDVPEEERGEFDPEYDPEQLAMRRALDLRKTAA